jgi:hypothetical protein
MGSVHGRRQRQGKNWKVKNRESGNGPHGRFNMSGNERTECYIAKPCSAACTESKNLKNCSTLVTARASRTRLLAPARPRRRPEYSRVTYAPTRAPMPAESAYGTCVKSMMRVRDWSARSVDWNSNIVVRTSGPSRIRTRVHGWLPDGSVIRRLSFGIRDINLREIIDCQCTVNSS